ncbi:MAG: hypothetical protein ACQESF_07340 [Nanobdellota archaeon]
MQKNKIHFYLSSALMLLGLFVLLAMFLQEPEALEVDAMFVSESVHCNDGTLAGECSSESLGNMCKITKQGPKLEFSPECYNK